MTKENKIPVLTEEDIKKARNLIYKNAEKSAECFYPVFEKMNYTWCKYDGTSSVPSVRKLIEQICTLAWELYPGSSTSTVSAGRIRVHVFKYETSDDISVRVDLEAESVLCF